MYASLKSYLQLIRSKNLLFLLLIQKLLEYAIIAPILLVFGFEKGNHLEFVLLNIASIFIAGGGYVINDYFDVEIDKVNKPERVIVEEQMSKKSALRHYFLLTGTGVLTGLLLAFRVQSFTLGFIFLFTVGLLWVYSSTYKRKLLTGNLIVSLVSALSLFITAILAITLLSNSYGINLLHETPIPATIYGWVGGFAFFAFMMTLIREMIKDMEDVEGDKELGCHTLPIVWGMKTAKWIIFFLIITTITVLLLIDTFWIPFEGTLSFWYIFVALVVPLLILIGIMIKAKEDCCFGKASTLAKLIMLMGILYSVIFYFLQAKTFNIPFFELFIVK